MSIEYMSIYIYIEYIDEYVYRISHQNISGLTNCIQYNNCKKYMYINFIDMIIKHLYSFIIIQTAVCVAKSTIVVQTSNVLLLPFY